MTQRSDPIVCKLPVADRVQRTADFRALFSAAFVDRQRLPDGVRWTLRADDRTEAECRRLAALEERCCDGILFGIRREGDVVVWHITGPVTADRTLDALFELPVAIATNEGAAMLWNALDGAGCGPAPRS